MASRRHKFLTLCAVVATFCLYNILQTLLMAQHFYPELEEYDGSVYEVQRDSPTTGNTNRNEAAKHGAASLWDAGNKDESGHNERILSDIRNQDIPSGNNVEGSLKVVGDKSSLIIRKSGNQSGNDVIRSQEAFKLPPKGCDVNRNVTEYRLVNGSKLPVPYWQRKLTECGQLGRGNKFFLAELLQVRIYEADKARWTVRELKQWLHFMFLSGVEHVFLCDHYTYEHERLDTPLKRYIELGLVTYLPWTRIRVPIEAQVQCYQYIIDTFKDYTTWQMAIDMDEYPFALRDPDEGFLERFIRSMVSHHGERLSEMYLSNYLMVGQGDLERDMVIERINRVKTPGKSGLHDMVKPIYRPEAVASAGVHHNFVANGTRRNADRKEIWMLHYWGKRLQDWGRDTPQTIFMSKLFNDMRDTWGPKVRNSLLTFGEFDAFSNTTGP